jgi:hypothetical protein
VVISSSLLLNKPLAILVRTDGSIFASVLLKACAAVALFSGLPDGLPVHRFQWPPPATTGDSPGEGVAVGAARLSKSWR